MFIINLLILSNLNFISIFAIQFSAWPGTDLSLTSNGGSQNDVNSNFLEYSDLPTESKDFDTEPPTAEEAESAAASVVAPQALTTTVEGGEKVELEKSLEGQRPTDEFNPETVFQDESEEYHCSNFPNQTLIRPHFFSCNSPGS